MVADEIGLTAEGGDGDQRELLSQSGTGFFTISISAVGLRQIVVLKVKSRVFRALPVVRLLHRDRGSILRCVCRVEREREREREERRSDCVTFGLELGCEWSIMRRHVST